MNKEKQIKSTDWLTRGMTKEQIERKKQEAVMAADLELCYTERIGVSKFYPDYDKVAEKMYEIGYRKQSKNTIELPCKAGDMAYVIYRGVITQGTVRLIRPFVSEQETIFKGNLICEVDNLFIDDGTKEEVELYVVFEKPYGIERIAYLNREEAEQALAKMKGGAE